MTIKLVSYTHQIYNLIVIFAKVHASKITTFQCSVTSIEVDS